MPILPCFRDIADPLFHPNYGVFPLDYADVVTLRCKEDSRLIIRVINYELVQPGPLYINVEDGRTDGRTGDLV